jgi:drug/metabolite transporter (DMT)-like permease
MSRTRVIVLTVLAMIAFAGNSLLCRIALRMTTIDPASFTWLRILSGALVLWLIVRARSAAPAGGNWTSAFALFMYGVTFSFAYASLSAATGALLLFGAVQATMIGYGLWRGERLALRQSAGLALAFGGLVWLMLPGLAQPPLAGSVLMLVSGAAWGIYSLRGKGAGDPARVTAGNFARAVPFAIALGVAMLPQASIDVAGFACAVASGSLASGVGYIIWYTALRGLSATGAAVVQLSVPILAALGGMLFLSEVVTLRLAIASIGILGGIALVIYPKRQSSDGA